MDTLETVSKARRYSEVDRASSRANVRMFSIQRKEPLPKIYAQSEDGWDRGSDWANITIDDITDKCSLANFHKACDDILLQYRTSEHSVSSLDNVTCSGGTFDPNSLISVAESQIGGSITPSSYPTELFLEGESSFLEQRFEQTVADSEPVGVEQSCYIDSYTQTDSALRERTRKHRRTYSVSSSGHSSSFSLQSSKKKKKCSTLVSSSDSHNTHSTYYNRTMNILNSLWPCDYFRGRLCSQYCKHSRGT